MATPQRGSSTIVASGNCHYCSGALPEARRITFCPHCGQNLTIRHCPACSTELELDWKYCTTCGRTVSEATT
jgi:predicted amidophosphoribosyltransferase